MPDGREERLAEIVKSALECPLEDQTVFLAERCGSDAELRAEAEALLEQQDLIGHFLEEKALHRAAAALLNHKDNLEGKVIGQYEIRSLIARGGMGEVYLAQDRRLQRKVALKLIRRGMDSADLILHFQREERLLAGLNHPNIAQLYGGGLTADGIPFFAMEYVEGLRIDEHCDEFRLSTEERLQLFRKVCAAVSYAHQHLVIHRDIKPANIRVAAEGEPKLLDFGIAKLLEPATELGAEKTLTFVGAMTPEYASPEQVRGEAIATTSDIYSLGVVLYKLLTGQSPYRTKTLRSDEITRAITDQDPERPSLAKTVQDSTDARHLRGDLDHIILKALRKEPERRYQSAAELSEDIWRHLSGLPVGAGKDTWSYRTGKFVRRNKIAAAATAVAAVILVGAMGVIIWQARIAVARGKVAAEQRDRAEHERVKAERINGFLQRMLSFSNQSIDSISPVPQKKDVTVNAMLDQIAPQVGEELPDQPEVRAKILHTIGSAYASQGRYQSAEKNLRAALQTEIDVNGSAAPEAAAIQVDLGVLLMRESKFEEAGRLLEKAVAFHRREQKSKPTAFQRAALAQALEGFGLTRYFQGDSKQAIALLRDAMTFATDKTETARIRLASIKTDLGGALLVSGDLVQGDRLLRESLAEFRQLFTEPRWEMGATLTMLGLSDVQNRKPEEATALLAEGEQVYRQTLGDENLYLAFNLHQQALAFFARSDFAAAEIKERQSLALTQALSPNESPAWADSFATLGAILSQPGRGAEGEQYWRQALGIYEKQMRKNYGAIAETKIALSKFLAAGHRLEEADALALTARDETAQSLGPDAPATKAAAANWLEIHERQGK